jgi:cytochrome c-type biogenesis protein CcmH/NrfG
MRSCIAVFYLTVSVLLCVLVWGDASAAQQASADPDALYAQREDVAKARAAADIWASRLAKTPGDFEAAWKLARAAYWLGGHAPQDMRRRDLETGMEAARTAIRLQPSRPEGHFWLAANMGGLAESFGMRQGIKYRKPVKQALEEVLRIDPSFQQGSADRVLGRWYYRVPALFGGSKTKSEEHLRRSLTYDPQSTASLYFLAETLVALGREADARQTLEKLEAVPINPEWGPEDREFKNKGRGLLKTL